MNFYILFQNVCLQVDLNKENIVVYILSKILLKKTYKYFPSDPFKLFQKYCLNIPNIFVICSFVRPNKSLFSRYAAEILIVHSSDHSIVRLFIIPIHCSFIRTIYHSSFVHNPYSSFVVRSYALFTVKRIIHNHYSLFILLFIVIPIAQIFNFSSIMMIGSPKTYQTNISVIRTPGTMIFFLVRTSPLVTHPRIAPS
jgi:hypothetical protein